MTRDTAAPPREAVCRSEDVARGALTAVMLGRAKLVLTRLRDGSVRAVAARCPHHGADLSFGQATALIESDRPGEMRCSRAGEILRCPWHGFEFDLASGDPVAPPPPGTRMRLRFFPVEERDGEIRVRAE